MRRQKAKTSRAKQLAGCPLEAFHTLLAFLVFSSACGNSARNHEVSSTTERSPSTRDEASGVTSDDDETSTKEQAGAGIPDYAFVKSLPGSREIWVGSLDGKLEKVSEGKTERRCALSWWGDSRLVILEDDLETPDQHSLWPSIYEWSTSGLANTRLEGSYFTRSSPLSMHPRASFIAMSTGTAFFVYDLEKDKRGIDGDEIEASISAVSPTGDIFFYGETRDSGNALFKTSNPDKVPDEIQRDLPGGCLDWADVNADGLFAAACRPEGMTGTNRAVVVFGGEAKVSRVTFDPPDAASTYEPPIWSPDGKKLATIGFGDFHRVELLDPFERTRKVLDQTTGTHQFSPSWINNREILYSVETQSGDEVRVANIETGEIRTILSVDFEIRKIAARGQRFYNGPC